MWYVNNQYKRRKQKSQTLNQMFVYYQNLVSFRCVRYMTLFYLNFNNKNSEIKMNS